MAAKTEKAAALLGDRILQNPIATDAAIMIVQQKLLKLLECKLINCNSLKQQIEDIRESLDPLYVFLTKHPERSEKKEWKSELLEAVYKIEDGIDIFKSRIALQGSEIVNQTIGIHRLNMFRMLCAKCLLWKCLQEFKSRMTTLKEVEYIPDKLEGSGSDKKRAPQIHDPKEWDQLFSLDISGKVMAARQSDMDELNKHIGSEEEENKIRVIVGEQGSGKTFLARKIFLHQRDNFDCCAWVNISGMAESGGVLRSLLKQVSDLSSLMPHLRQPSSVLKELLCAALFEKSYLIVLDDVFDSFPLWDVLESFPNSNSRSLLLITTEDKLRGILDPQVKELKEIKDEESKILIESKLAIAGRVFRELMKCKESQEFFLNKCRGSPLRLNLLGGLIAKSSNPMEIIKTIPDTDDLNQLFAYCYNKMPGELKPCFLYMTLFPKSDAIPVRRLQRLWLSEGLLVVPKGARMEPEDLGLDYLKELMFRNLIEAVERKEDGSPRKIRVVTCLYDLFHSGAIGTELLYVNTRKETKEGQPPGDQQHQAASRLRWLVERSNIEDLSLSPVAKINRVRTFLSFNFREGKLTQDIGDFLETTMSGKHFNLLTVLDLEGVYKPNLEKVLGKLVLLKHLGLRSTALGLLPKSVADLPYLETLDLKYTNITELPKSIWKKSSKLRHLYLNGYCRIDRHTLSSSFATGTKPFANLHTLSEAVVDGIDVEEVGGTVDPNIMGFSNMKKLTKLGIKFQCLKKNQNAIGDWISGLTNLQSLKLGIFKSSNALELPQQLSLTRHCSLSNLYLLGKFNQSCKHLIPHNLLILTLSGSKMNMEHILQLGDLPNLKALNLKADSFTGDILTFSEGCLQNLHVLRLWKLENTRILELKNKMPSIKIIEFRDCPKMEDIKHIKEVGAEQKMVLLQLIEMKAKFVNEMRECVKGSKIKVNKPRDIGPVIRNIKVEEDFDHKGQQEHKVAPRES